MSVTIKNIILYDNLQRVQGFVEFRKTDQLEVQVRHNFTLPGLILAITCHGKTHVVNLASDEHYEVLPMDIDPSRDEILASLILREGGNLETLASGIINIQGIRPKPVIPAVVAPPPPPVPPCAPQVRPTSRFAPRSQVQQVQTERDTKAAREVDEMIKKMCCYEEDGIEACVGCEYRKHFYFDVSS